MIQYTHITPKRLLGTFRGQGDPITMKQMTTNDLFTALVRDLSILSLEAYRQHYTELTRRVNAEGNQMTTEAMHIAILNAHNTNQEQQ